MIQTDGPFKSDPCLNHADPPDAKSFSELITPGSEPWSSASRQCRRWQWQRRGADMRREERHTSCPSYTNLNAIHEESKLNTLLRCLCLLLLQAS